MRLIEAEPSLAEARLSHRSSLAYPALVVATFLDRTEVVKALIAAGADIEVATEPEGWRPLHFAAQHGLTGPATVLLDAGYEVEAGDRRGKSPLFWALVKRQFVLAELLLQRGASIHQRWGDGYSLLHHEAKDGHNEALTFMLEPGPDPTARRGKVGPTPRRRVAAPARRER